VDAVMMAPGPPAVAMMTPAMAPMAIAVVGPMTAMMAAAVPVAFMTIAIVMAAIVMMIAHLRQCWRREAN
jgi:hypothetical protein